MRYLRRSLICLLLATIPGIASANDYLFKHNEKALIGAVLGAAIGYQIDDHDGAVVGSIVGTLAGSALDRRYDYRRADRRWRRLEFARLQNQRLREEAARRIQTETLEISLAGDEAFDVGQALLKPTANTTLSSVVRQLSSYPQTVVHIVGHTDATGLPYPNEVLSLARAQSVARYLIENGIPRTRMVIDGMGEMQPLVDNDTAANRRLNRRVDIVVSPVFNGL